MSEPAVITVNAGEHKLARRVIVSASAAELFTLVADPHRHPELDGSGTVRDVPVTGPHRLAQGMRFTVGMRFGLVPYRITSTVVDFEDDHVLEWAHPLGHHWRWEFREIDSTTTEVTQTFDYSSARSPKVLERLGYPAKNADAMTKTLRALARRYQN
ncbi:MAG: SRPBCC family protein [Actinobacteria bacterium]|nr:SRPBCC family protein [Actinomycetota bacterium]